MPLRTVFLARAMHGIEHRDRVAGAVENDVEHGLLETRRKIGRVLLARGIAAAFERAAHPGLQPRQTANAAGDRKIAVEGKYGAGHVGPGGWGYLKKKRSEIQKEQSI